jgi:hypothetical protein
MASGIPDANKQYVNIVFVFLQPLMKIRRSRGEGNSSEKIWTKFSLVILISKDITLRKFINNSIANDLFLKNKKILEEDPPRYNFLY